jgi:deoxyribonuclease-4
MKRDKNMSSAAANESDRIILGAHESIEGGIFRAVERAESIRCTALQVFTKNSNQWHSKQLTEQDIANYKNALSKSRIRRVMAHDSYLINLCAQDCDVLQKSREAFIDEIIRCDLLSIPLLVFHPGAHMGAGESEGLKKIIDALNYAHDKTAQCNVVTLLETTAGQGTTLGYRFEHLRKIIDGIENLKRIGVCMDTCHIYAAGYNIAGEKEYENVMKGFDDVIGIGRLCAIHVNDSKKDLGSRVDRHEHIGKGKIGKRGFRCLMQDPRFIDIPKVIETDKEKDLREDVVNLNLLRRLARQRKSSM